MAIQEIIDYWTRTNTPAQSVTQIAAYLGIAILAAIGGWIVRGVTRK